jgi:hypothetical protein
MSARPIGFVTISPQSVAVKYTRSNRRNDLIAESSETFPMPPSIALAMAFDAEAERYDVRRYVGMIGNDPFWNVNLTIANSIGAIEVTRRLIEIRSDGSIRVSGYFNCEVAAIHMN